jgi:glycine C-acetyltransferase
VARLVSRALTHLGLIANLVEFPAVPKGAARFRLQVMAGHTLPQIDLAVSRMKMGLEIAMGELEDIVRTEERAVA